MKRNGTDKVNWMIFTVIILVFLITTFFLAFFPDLHAKSAEYQKKRTGKSTWSVISLFNDHSGRNSQIRLELPDNVDYKKITSESDVTTSRVSIHIPGADAAYPEDYKMTGSTGRMQDILFTYSDSGDTIEFCFDKFYETRLSEKNGWLCIDFKRPKELYKNVVLIDPYCNDKGHSAQNSGVYEKDISLDIVKKMKTRFEADTPKGTKVYYTRTGDSDMNDEERARLCDSVQADIFLSVALNSTSSGRTSSMQGAAAEYLTTDATGAGKTFASECLDGLLRGLGCQNRGLIPGDEESILKTQKRTAALVRIGYISNDEERGKLVTKKYQDEAAESLYQAILKNLKDMQ